MADRIRIELAAALPGRQLLIELELPGGATVADAIAASAIPVRWPEFPLDVERVGVFGRQCGLDRRLEDGDRVELYRPLTADPKEIRRQLAELERRGRGS